MKDYAGLREALRRHKARKDCEFDIKEIAALLAELDSTLAERDALRADALRYRAIKAHHAYALVRRFTDNEGYRSHLAPAQIDAWADAACKEVAEWDAKTPEEQHAWYEEQAAAIAARSKGEGGT